MKSLVLFLSFFIFNSNSFSQEKPKLVVGIVVDQLRYDLLKRFEHNFSENGIKKLMKNGFFAENMHYDYAPTYTGPGHASIYTGTVPSLHGIAANTWFQNGTSMYCTQDDNQTSVGSSDTKGKMSPQNLLATTLTDQLLLFSNQQSKVVSISLKDRGAILPGGHMSNDVYWYNGSAGNWITSTYYQKKLPQWVADFNANNYPKKLMKSGWNLSLTPKKYLNIQNDNNRWEHSITGNKACFPYTFDTSQYYSHLPKTSHGNTLTSLLAIEALKKKSLGKDKYTDFLAVSYSSTDYIGHAYGPYSLEIEDAYYVLDREIEKLINEIEKILSKDEYLLFLTGDHGVQDIPEFCEEINIPAGRNKGIDLKNKLELHLSKKYTFPILKTLYNSQLYLSQKALEDNNVEVSEIVQYLNKIEQKEAYGIQGFYEYEKIMTSSLHQEIKSKLANGYVPSRSGQIAILMYPNWIIDSYSAATHGSPYNHDSHVPFLLYGKNVTQKSSAKRYHITDIASTISYFLGILQPNASIGNPIYEAVKNDK